MMRWLVAGSRKSKGLVVALGIGLVVLGFVQLRAMPRDSLPEFSPVHGAGADRGARALCRGGGTACHRPARTGSAQRRRVPRSDPLRVAPGDVEDRAHLRARDRSWQGAAGRERAPDAGRRPPERLTTSADDPTALVDEPADDDRSVLRGPIAHRSRRPGPLDDPSCPHGHPRGRERLGVGAARTAAPGAGGPEGARREGCVARRRHPHDGQRPLGVAAHLPGGVDPRGRRLLRHQRAADRRRAPPADQDARGPGGA